MENLEKYLKYYFLEDYLFNDVHKNFKNYGYLKPEEFLTIVIWKSNRAKTKFKIKSRGKLNAEKIETTTKELHSLAKNCEENERKILDVITGLSGVGIPVASAIITVCYPNYFTIVDYRAKTSLIKYLNHKKGIGSDYKKIFGADPQSSKKAYLAYCRLCRHEAEKLKITLRDFDRMLFGMDFYNGKNGLRDLVKELK